jgi:hypothetical protein
MCMYVHVCAVCKANAHMLSEGPTTALATISAILNDEKGRSKKFSITLYHF